MKSDDFNGTKVDPTVWNVRDSSTFGNLSYDRAVIRGSQVQVSGGMLRITAQRLAKPVPSPQGDRWFATGYVDSRIVRGGDAAMKQRYGRWEMRAKIPTVPGVSRGVWPAFWLRNDGLGELDIMEAWGSPSPRPGQLVGTSTLTIHENTNGNQRKKGWTYEKLVGATAPSSNDFHTWAVEYTPTYMRGYFDGKLAVNVTPAQYPWLWGPNFTTPFHMRLNLQMGDPYWAYPDPAHPEQTASPAVFLVDYVRVYGWKG